MRNLSLLALAILVPSLSCLAQNHAAGFNYNVTPGATSRGVLAVLAGELIQRFDYEEMRGFDQTLDGIRAIVQDQDGSTPELFQLWIYTEDPANPDFPNFAPGTPPGTTSIGGVANLPGPSGVTGPQAALLTATFLTPINLNNLTADLFVSFEVPAAALWTNDGLSVQINLGINPNFPPPNTNTYDLKGPAPIAQTSYGLIHDVSNSAFAYGGTRQMMVEIMTDLPSSVATTQTGQASYPISNTVPGTASFMSGLHPDALRSDNIGHLFFDPTLPVNSPVFFLAEFSFTLAPLQWNQVLLGSVGDICLPPSFIVLSLQLSTAGAVQATQFYAIPVGSQPLFVGQNLVTSAVAFDVALQVLRGGYCVKQAF